MALLLVVDAVVEVDGVVEVDVVLVDVEVVDVVLVGSVLTVAGQCVLMEAGLLPAATDPRLPVLGCRR